MATVLLMKGGQSEEHEIALVSSQFFADILSKMEGIDFQTVLIDRQGNWTVDGKPCFLSTKTLHLGEKRIAIDYAIPCFHGPPGETGEIQGLLDLLQIPYLGPNHQASINCFNKITTKLWLEQFGIHGAPFLPLLDSGPMAIESANRFFTDHGEDIFVKAAEQGSSRGCYHVQNKSELADKICEAFKYSSRVILEKTIRARELEVAVFEWQGEIRASAPGEIICPGGFYSYEEKYNSESKTRIDVEATNLSDAIKREMKAQALWAYRVMGLKDLARIDFFLTEDRDIFLNEINTFPGHTKISMFPMMLEGTGIRYQDYLKALIEKAINS